MIFPDVRGLYPFYVELAERFAQAGYHAIAIDYFGRTAGLGPRDEDFEYMPHVQQLKVPQVQEDAAAAVAALRERAGADRFATVGFCLGGMESFLAGADMSELTAVVGFYAALDGSRFGISGPLQRAAEIRTPLLGLFGGADQAIPVEQVEEFDAAHRSRPRARDPRLPGRAALVLRPPLRGARGGVRGRVATDARLPRAPHRLSSRRRLRLPVDLLRLARV